MNLECFDEEKNTQCIQKLFILSMMQYKKNCIPEHLKLILLLKWIKCDIMAFVRKMNVLNCDDSGSWWEYSWNLALAIWLHNQISMQ